MSRVCVCAGNVVGSEKLNAIIFTATLTRVAYYVP